MIELIKKRLSSWKKRFLSFGGRLVLIKSVISSLPIYYMSLFKIPEGVAKCIEQIQADFYGKLISWDKISRGKDKGGLDVRNIRIMNQCLLCKWHWRFGAEYGALWKKLICSKYDMELSDWNSIEVCQNSLSRVWIDISSAKDRVPLLFHFFHSNLKIKIGDGVRVKFWQYVWFGDGSESLKIVFPRLFLLSVDNKASVAEIMDRSKMGGGILFSEEVYEVGNLMNSYDCRICWQNFQVLMDIVVIN